jgi:serpin B
MMQGMPPMALISLLVTSVFLCGCFSAPEDQKPESSVQMHLTDIEQTAIASNRFAVDMYRELAGKDENVFFSPWSLNTALAMTYEGARGKTAEEMRSVLHFSGNESARRQSFSSLDRRINANESGYTLSTASALWVDSNFSLLDDYANLVDHDYHAKTMNLNFKVASDDARRTINSWVEQKTSHKIKELIPPGNIDPSTRLILTNAVYFKGKWANEFDRIQTWDEKFITGDGRTVMVPMMRQLDEDIQFDYLETEDMQMLQMPYLGENLSLVILLPKERAISQVESSLNGEKLAQWRKRLELQHVDVYIPKFKIDASYILAENLTNLGMSNAFASRADFSGISARRELFISEVVHQAYVAVNEDGTEAAAATAVTTETAIPQGPKTPVFRADHPFIFMIQDNETGCILFLGRVSDPGAN